MLAHIKKLCNRNRRERRSAFLTHTGTQFSQVERSEIAIYQGEVCKSYLTFFALANRKSETE